MITCHVGAHRLCRTRPRARASSAGAEGTGELPPGGGNPSGNIGLGTPGGAPYQSWAADLVKKRMAANSKDIRTAVASLMFLCAIVAVARGQAFENLKSSFVD